MLVIKIWSKQASLPFLWVDESVMDGHANFSLYRML